MLVTLWSMTVHYSSLSWASSLGLVWCKCSVTSAVDLKSNLCTGMLTVYLIGVVGSPEARWIRFPKLSKLEVFQVYLSSSILSFWVFLIPLLHSIHHAVSSSSQSIPKLFKDELLWYQNVTPNSPILYLSHIIELLVVTFACGTNLLF